MRRFEAHPEPFMTKDQLQPRSDDDSDEEEEYDSRARTLKQGKAQGPGPNRQPGG